MSTPPSKEVKEFQFKLKCKLRVFNPDQKLNVDNPLKLVTAASKYGLIFAGCPTGLICLGTTSLLKLNVEPKNKNAVLTEFPRREVPLPSQPTHLDVSADNELLAAAVIVQDIPVLHIYAVSSFGSANLVKKFEMRMSNTPGTRVSDLQWNPGGASMIGAVLSDGSAVVFDCKDDSSFSVNSIPPNAQASCLCWSPKGKQVVIGAKNGSLTQCKPELKVVKTFPPPLPNMSVVSVHWLSSFQFIAAFKTDDPSARPVAFIVNVPKNSAVSYIPYEDVCFGSLSKRGEFHFIHQQTWNLLLMGNGDSMEISVLGFDAGTNSWTQWLQEDYARGELPLTENCEDVHSVGLAMDLSPNLPVQVNDVITVGPMPLTVMMSHVGVLCVFTTLNMMPGAPVVCIHPQPLPDQSGFHLFITPKPQVANVNLQSPQPPQPQLAAAAPQPTFQPSVPSTPQPTLFPSPPTATPSAASPGFSLPNFSLASTAFQAKTTPPQQSSFSFMGLQQQASPLTVAPPATPSPLTQQPIQPSVSTPQMAPQPTVSLPQMTVPALSGFSLQPKPPLLSTPSSTSVPPASSGVSLFSSPNFSTPTVASTPTSIVAPSIGTPPVSGLTFGLSKDEAPSKTEVVTKPVELPSIPALPPVEEEKEVVAEIDDSVYTEAIHQELTSFEAEMSSVKKFINSMNYKVGEEEVKGSLSLKTESIEGFTKELVDTTAAQQAEVNSLRGSLIDIITMLKCIKTKQSLMSNPRLLEIREAEDLDPINKQKLKNIEEQLYYLQSQLKQIAAHIDSVKKEHDGNIGLAIPKMTMVLQILKTNSCIFNTQKGIIGDIEEKLKDRVKKIVTRNNYSVLDPISPRKKISEEDSQLSTLAQKLLQTKLSSNIDIPSSYRESSKRIIAMNMSKNKFSSAKEQALVQWHEKHKVISTNVSRKSPNVASSFFNSPLKPPVAMKKTSMDAITTPPKVETSLVLTTPKVITKVPLPAAEIKPVNRNLFASAQAEALELNMSTCVPELKNFGGIAITSTPLVKEKSVDKPIIKPISTIQSSLQPNIFSPNVSNPPIKVSFPPANIPSSNIFSSTAKPFVPLSTGLTESLPSSTQPVLFSKVDKVPSKDNRSKDTVGTSQTQTFTPGAPSSAFNFSGIANKENSAAVSISVPSTQAVSQPVSLFTLPKSTSVFGGFGSLTVNQNPLKFTPNSSSNAPEKAASEIPVAPVVEKTSKEISAPVSSVSTNIFGGISNTPSVVSSTVTTTSIMSGNFSFNFPSGQPTTATTTVTTSASNIFGSSSLFSTNTSASGSTFSFGSISSMIPSVPSTGLTITPIIPSTTVSSVLPSPVPVTTAAVAVTAAVPTTVTTATAPPTVGNAATASSSVATAVTISPSITSASSVAAASPIFSLATSTPAFGSSFSTTSSTSSSIFSPPSFVSSPATTTVTTASSTTPSDSAPSPGSTFGGFGASTTASSIFGSAALKFATTSAPLMFGQTPATVSSSPAIFSQPNVTSAPLFGQPTTSAPSLFGQPSTTTSSTPLFSQVPQPTTSAPMFGSTSFGSPPAFGSAPAFGSPPGTTSVFGSPSSFVTPTTAAAPLLFGSPTPPATTSSNIFGTPTSSTPSVFGAPFTTSSGAFGAPLFGQAPTAPAQSSPFGGAAATPPANPFFGQASSPVFSQTQSAGNFGSSGGSLFGGSSSFGATQQQAAFPQSGGSIFGVGASPGGGGPFSSGGGQSVIQSGFSSFQQQKPGAGFGAAPVFGSSPSFGGAPTFGAAPSSPGSPGGFGTTGTGTMFESLANQNTMTFGNLAQNQPNQPTQPAFGSPQQPTTFGGNSFSSWR